MLSAKMGQQCMHFRFRNTQVMLYIHIIMTPICMYIRSILSHLWYLSIGSVEACYQLEQCWRGCPMCYKITMLRMRAYCLTLYTVISYYMHSIPFTRKWHALI